MLKPRIILDKFYVQSSCIFLAIFLIYLLSMPRTVVLEDDGIFILAAFFNGIAHAPGYPLITLLGHLAIQIPLGSVASRTHALSAFFGAASIVVLHYIGMKLFNNRVLAVGVALGFGISRTFWSQAIITEVYTLNTFIYLVLFSGAIYFVRSREIPSGKFICLMMFIYGLGLSNHWPVLILSTPSIFAVLWPRIRDVLRNIPVGLLFLILGLTPYVWMVVRSHMNPVISFYGPLNNWHDIWFMISRRGYADMDHQVGANYLDKLHFCAFCLKQSMWQLGPLSGVLAILGFARQWKRWPMNICIGLILAYSGSTFVLCGLMGFTYMPMSQDVFKVYPLIAYFALVVWTILGVAEVAFFIKEKLKLEVTQRAVNLIFTGVVLITGLASNLPINYRVNDKLAENYALTILSTLNKDAIFFTTGDLDTGPLGYFNLIQKVRPDVSLYNVSSLIFNNRLEKPILLDEDNSYKTLSEFIQSQQRPIYYINDMPLLYGIRDYGLYHQVDKSMEKGGYEVVENSIYKTFMESLLKVDRLYDPWENMLHKLLIADYCRIELLMHYFEHPLEQQAEVLRVCRGYYGLLAAANIILTSPDANLKFVLSLLENAYQLRDEALNKEDFAKYYRVKAIYLEKQGKIENAIFYNEIAVEIWPDDKNPAYRKIQDLSPKIKK